MPPDAAGLKALDPRLPKDGGLACCWLPKAGTAGVVEEVVLVLDPNTGSGLETVDPKLDTEDEIEVEEVVAVIAGVAPKEKSGLGWLCVETGFPNPGTEAVKDELSDVFDAGNDTEEDEVAVNVGATLDCGGFDDPNENKLVLELELVVFVAVVAAAVAPVDVKVATERILLAAGFCCPKVKPPGGVGAVDVATELAVLTTAGVEDVEKVSPTLGCGDPKAGFGCVDKLKPLLEEAAEIAGVVVVVSLGLLVVMFPKLNTGLGADSETLVESLEAIALGMEADDAAGSTGLAPKVNVAVPAVDVGADVVLDEVLVAINGCDELVVGTVEVIPVEVIEEVVVVIDEELITAATDTVAFLGNSSTLLSTSSSLSFSSPLKQLSIRDSLELCTRSMRAFFPVSVGECFLGFMKDIPAMPSSSGSRASLFSLRITSAVS